MLIDALHAPFEDREEAFNGVRSHIAARVFLIAMVDGLMLGKFLAGMLVVLRFVGMQSALAADVRQRGFDGVGFEVGDDDGAGTAATLDKAKNLALGRSATFLNPTAIIDEYGVGTADKGFVGFNDLAVAAHRAWVGILHGLADTMAHKPSRLVSNPQEAMYLMGADALFRRAHEMRSRKPLVKGNMRTLVHGADRGRELLFAGIAVVQAGAIFALNRAGFLGLATMGAVTTFGPAKSLEMGSGLGFVVEDRIGEIAHGSVPCF